MGIEDEPNPPIIDNTTNTGEEEEIPSPPGMFNINDEFATSTTMEEDEKSNNYYDNIDHEILRNEESTIVFEDNSLAPTTVTNGVGDGVGVGDVVGDGDGEEE